MIMNNWLKLGFDIHHWSISHLGWLQDYIGMLSHLDFGYFDLVNPVDQVTHICQSSDSKIQHGLYLFETCPWPILQFQIWEFGLGSPKKWLLSLNYWPNDLFLFQKAVWLVLLEHCSVRGGMSSLLYHSSMSPDTSMQSFFPSSRLEESYDAFYYFQRLYH